MTNGQGYVIDSGTADSFRGSDGAQNGGSMAGVGSNSVEEWQRRHGEAIAAVVDRLSASAAPSSELVNSSLVLSPSLEPPLQSMGLLVKLGRRRKAIAVCLTHASALLQFQASRIHFQGDVLGYVQTLSELVFSQIKQTTRLCQHLFANDASLMPGVIVWATQELSKFAADFEAHVFSTDAGFEQGTQCLDSAFQECKRLEAVGLILSPVLSSLLAPASLVVVEKNFAEVQLKAAQQLAKEDWQVCEVWVRTLDVSSSSAGGAGGGGGKRELMAKKETSSKHSLKLTASSRYLYNVVRTLLNNLAPVLDPAVFPSAVADLYPVVVPGLVALVEKYLLRMSQVQTARAPAPTPSLKGKIAAKEREKAEEKGGRGGEGVALSDSQCLGILANAYYLSEDLVPRILHAFTTAFGRPIPEVIVFAGKTSRLVEALQDSFVQRTVSYCLDVLWNWSRLLSSPSPPSKASASSSPSLLLPSKGVRSLLAHLCGIKATTHRCLNSSLAGKLLSSVIEGLLTTLLEPEYWSNFTPLPAVAEGEEGRNILLLDLRFLVKACTGPTYMSKRAVKAALMCEERIIGLADKDKGGPKINAESWFDACIAACLDKGGAQGCISLAFSSSSSSSVLSSSVADGTSLTVSIPDTPRAKHMVIPTSVSSAAGSISVSSSAAAATKSKAITSVSSAKVVSVALNASSAAATSRPAATVSSAGVVNVGGGEEEEEDFEAALLRQLALEESKTFKSRKI